MTVSGTLSLTLDYSLGKGKEEPKCKGTLKDRGELFRYIMTKDRLHGKDSDPVFVKKTC